MTAAGSLPVGAPIPLDLSKATYATWIRSRRPQLKVHAKPGHAKAALSYSREDCDAVMYRMTETGWVVDRVYLKGQAND